MKGWFSNRCCNCRLVDHQIQDFSALARYYQQFNLLTEGLSTTEMEKKFLEAISDFHVLLYIATMDMLPLKVRFCKQNCLVQHNF